MIRLPGFNFVNEADAIRVSREILERLLGPAGMPGLSVRFWDGTPWPDNESRAATLILNRPSALKEMLAGGSEVAMAEAYVRNTFDVEGDMIAACALSDRLAEHTRGWTRTFQVAAQLAQLPNLNEPAFVNGFGPARLTGRQHSQERDRRAIQFHYDLSNDFYALWLDPRLVYSCAYFDTLDTSLEMAQVGKLEHICRKLDLRPGERFLDIGCGWGALLLHAAKRHGVRAEGVTLSQNQFDFVKQRAGEENLQDRVTVHLLDYRELPEREGYDKIASIGMVEHVGTSQLPHYFEKVSDLLKPGGLFLNHGIGLGPQWCGNDRRGFIKEFVFPDSDLQPIGRMLEAARTGHFEIHDVESLRHHYTKTLRHWLARLEARHDEAASYVGEEAYRVWRLYLAGSAHGFLRGYINVYQTLLAKLNGEGFAPVPLTRKAWYAPEPAARADFGKGL
jgi:cyclopropane-fatty-acyl-phospholipid synthase